MTWTAGPYLAFDTETTGVLVESDRIVTATTVLLQPGVEPVVTSWLIDPGVEIPEGASDVHGITTEHAREFGRQPAECVREIALHVTGAWANGIPVLAFNAPYDLTILDRELRRHDLAPLDNPGPVLDPFLIDKQVDRYRKGSRKLTAVCDHYGVKHGGAHDATADALAAARVMWAIGQRYPDLAAMPLEQVHDAQIGWCAQQAASFRNYLIAKGTTDDLPTGDWPMRPYTKDHL